MLAAVCCKEAAWPSVRPASSWLPRAMCTAAWVVPSMPRYTSCAMPIRLLRMTSSENIRLPISSSDSATICVVRLPAATWRAMLAASTTGPVTERDRRQPSRKTAATPRLTSAQPKLAPVVLSASQFARRP